VAMVKRVAEMFTKQGAEPTFKAVSDKSVPNFHDRDLYPFIYDLKGNCVAWRAAGTDRQESSRPEGSGRQIPDPRNGRHRQWPWVWLGQLQVAESAQQQD